MFYKKRIEALERLVKEQAERTEKTYENLYAGQELQRNKLTDDYKFINGRISDIKKQVSEHDKILANHTDVLREAKELYIALKEDKDKCNEQISSLEKQIEELKAGLIRQNAQVQASALQKFDEWLNGAKQ